MQQDIRLKAIAPLVVDMEAWRDEAEWSTDDKQAKEIDTPAWESSDTSMDKDDRKKLRDQLDSSSYSHEIIMDEDEMSTSFDPDLCKK